MVRETRFAFEDDPHRTMQPTTGYFDEEDDLFLDGFHSPSPPETPKSNRKSPAPQRIADRKSGDKRGHLSDADWIDPPKLKPRRRKSA